MQREDGEQSSWNSQASWALTCACPGNSHPPKRRTGIAASLAGMKAYFSRRDGPENKTQCVGWAIICIYL